MSDFRDAQNNAHPNKTNTLMLAILGMLVGIVILQIWLLTTTLNSALGGNEEIVWPSFYASLALFIGGCALLRYLPQPLRLPAAKESAETFADSGLAWRTLCISSVSLALAFSVWFMWSAIAVKLAPSGFKISQEQKFWLIAAPVILTKDI